MTVLYVDVSHHDWSRYGGQLDWARIRSATSPVMCARATYGDPAGYNPATRHFATMARGARSAGFDVIGGYHNLIKGDQASINRQVDYLRRTLDGAGANWAMLDVERYEELVANGMWPRFDDVRQFVDRWRAVDGRTLTVYLPRWIWDGHLGRPDLRVLGCPLVASDYGSNPNGTPAQVYKARGGDGGRGWNAYGNVTPTIWQFGSNVDCPGASGQTDCNAYRGTLAQLRALLAEGDDVLTPEDIQKIAVASRDAVLKAELGREGNRKKVEDLIALAGGLAPQIDTTTMRTDATATRTETAVGRIELAISELPRAVVSGLGAADLDDVVTALVAAGVDPAELRDAAARAVTTGA